MLADSDLFGYSLFSLVESINKGKRISKAFEEKYFIALNAIIRKRKQQGLTYDSAGCEVILLDDPVTIRVDKNPIAIIANTGSWVGNNAAKGRG